MTSARDGNNKRRDVPSLRRRYSSSSSTSSSSSSPSSHRHSMRRAPRSRRPSGIVSLASAALLLLLDRHHRVDDFFLLRPLPTACAYITSGLPPHTHRAFLRRLTDDICNTDPGTLTPMEISNAPVLISAWVVANDGVDHHHHSRIGPSGGGRRRGGGGGSGDNNDDGVISGRERAMAVESLLKRIIDERRAGNPDAIARTEDYNAVMKSWATSGERSAAAIRVEQILMNMQDMFASGDLNVQPNLESFQIAVEAWTRATDEPNALVRARRILDWMTKVYLSGGNELAKPDVSCFRPILKCYASSGKIEAPIVSEHLLMHMQRLRDEHGIEGAGPDVNCFNIVMSSWLKSGDVASERHIRQIFEYMDECRRLGCTDIRPDSSTYNIVISSIAPAVKKRLDVGGARRADGILSRLESGYLSSLSSGDEKNDYDASAGVRDDGGSSALRPDTIVYNQVIDYWAKTQSVDGHYLKARAVLDRQVEMHVVHGVRKCRPDVTGYTSVIGACASTYGPRGEKRRAFDVAHSTFMELCKLKHARPNDVTYGLMFKAVARLIPEKEERDRYSRTLFGLCRDDGCLGEMAYNRLREAVTTELLQELTGGRAYADLPGGWKRNIKSHSKKSYDGNRQTSTKDKLRP
ncbi:hypothetical protein ACHAXA_011446 [Cyclostephanos tholiformis]|uniref:Pentatricopeptide repeat-containing protein n=1 Tax=Cyclostephanos tholiformis TaxID=382380 RepID=A0ABD3RVU9_9STRA